MKRTTIMLPQELKATVEREALLRGVSFGEAVRIALKQAYYPTKKAKKQDPLFNFDVTFNVPCEKDLSAHHDTYLQDEMV